MAAGWLADPPVAKAAGEEVARACLEACAGDEVDGVAATVKQPLIDLAGGILEDKIRNAVAIDIRNGDDAPVAEAAGEELA